MANAAHYISLPLSQTASAKRPCKVLLRSFCNNALLTILSTPLLESLFSTGPFWKGLQYSLHFSPLFSTKSTNGVHLPRMSLPEANKAENDPSEEWRKIAVEAASRKQFPYQLMGRSKEMKALAL